MLKSKANWGVWQHFWGVSPLPAGAEAICVIESGDDIGALLRLKNGSYVQGNHGCIKQLNQDDAMAIAKEF